MYMSETEEIEAMLELHRETLNDVVRLATSAPGMVDELIRVLQQSSVIFIPNAPERQEGYQTLVNDVINLLRRIKAGEVDPKAFLTTRNNEDDHDQEAEGTDYT